MCVNVDTLPWSSGGLEDRLVCELSLSVIWFACVLSGRRAGDEHTLVCFSGLSVFFEHVLSETCMGVPLEARQAAYSLS